MIASHDSALRFDDATVRPRGVTRNARQLSNPTITAPQVVSRMWPTATVPE